MAGMPRELTLMTIHAGGVPVVVRDRESLSHGEGEQFEVAYECRLPDQTR